MDKVEQRIWDAAARRVADIFGRPVACVHEDLRFGEDLRGSFVSDFKRNELDIINDDINDVADRMTRKDIMAGVLVIKTVGDYCRYMVRCHGKMPLEVNRLLRVD